MKILAMLMGFLALPLAGAGVFAAVWLTTRLIGGLPHVDSPLGAAYFAGMVLFGAAVIVAMLLIGGK